MYNVISLSKYENETISLVLDFSDLLKTGEVISTCVFDITLQTGIDSNPTNILYQVYIATGTRVDQKFRLGVPGVIYEIVWQVTGSAGSVVEKTTFLAILPQAGVAIPSFTFIYLTSYLYPYNTGDSLSTFMLPRSGRDFSYPPEQLSSSYSPVRGSIYGGQVTYNIPIEILTANSLLPTRGSIYGGQVTYSIPSEGVNGFCAPVLGSVYGSSLSYNIPSEGINGALSPISGTIS